MFDIKMIRDNPARFDAALAKRGLESLSASLLMLDSQKRELVGHIQAMQTRRNALSREIGKAKGQGDDAQAAVLMKEVTQLRQNLQKNEAEERRLGAELEERLAGIPNLPLDAVPEGASEDDNVEQYQHGEARAFDFPPKEHFELGEKPESMDFATAARLSGSRFVILQDNLARLERALAGFMIDLHTREFGYREVSPPLLVRDSAMFGTGQLPKMADDAFRTDNGLWLVPTAEVSLTNMVRESLLDEDSLPLRLTASTPCFRKEAGAAGRDTRGMIRVHQFSKVELVSITTPEQSAEEHKRMLSCAEEVLKRLGLHYRVMLLSAGDMGFGAAMTYDIEVWLPGQGRYREISSCSLCGDFQARRMQARFRPASGKGTRFVHTLNGSALAVGRTLVAVLENYQQEDGTIAVPEVLQPYMGGLEVINAPA